MSPHRPTFAADLRLFVLDEGGVVFSEAAQEIYELNAAATYIWCRLEEGADPARIPLALAETFGFTASEAEAHARGILAEWRDLGFFGGGGVAGAGFGGAGGRSGGARPASQPAARGRSAIAKGQAPRKPLPIECCYRVLGRDFRIGLASRGLEEWIAPVLSHLQVPCSEARPGAARFTVEMDREGYLIAEAGRPGSRCTSPEDIAPLVNYLVFTRAIAQAGYAVAFHAGAVSDGRRGLVLPGNQGSGKTSLTAALLHAGFHYLSDELILLQAGRTEIGGVPFSLCVKESGVELLARYFPDLANLAVHQRPDGKRVRYLPPPAAALRSESGHGVRAAWVVFPRYQAEAPTRLDGIRRSEALRRLMKTCTLSTPLTHQQVKTFIDWLRGVACFELPMSSLDEAAGLLRDLWRDP